MDDLEAAYRRRALVSSHLLFNRYFFRKKKGIPFLTAPYHRLLCSLVDMVFTGKVRRLIVNMPPGYGKTEIFAISLMARGLAMNPNARMLHLTYSQELAENNSELAKELVLSDAFQELWPLRMNPDCDSKGHWRIEGTLGEVRASAAGAAVTGFRAGHMDKAEFTGALIIDDPIKPQDAQYKTQRDNINRQVNNTVESRLAQPRVPIIVIQQRVHLSDVSGYLLQGGMSCKWHHCEVPVWSPDGELPPYPDIYTHGIRVKYRPPKGPLWPYKHSAKAVKGLEKADPGTFWAQYMERPVSTMGAIFRLRDFGRWEAEPSCRFRIITVDTAVKAEEHNDYTVFQMWGLAWHDGRAYLLDQLRARMEAAELEEALVDWFFKHRWREGDRSICQAVHIEDKSSGSELIQRVAAKGVPVMPIKRDGRDKVERANQVAPLVRSGLAVLPAAGARPWCAELKSELMHFPDAVHDDQVDCLVDALFLMFGAGGAKDWHRLNYGPGRKGGGDLTNGK